jgi:hypothetical protein
VFAVVQEAASLGLDEDPFGKGLRRPPAMMDHLGLGKVENLEALGSSAPAKIRILGVQEE